MLQESRIDDWRRWIPAAMAALSSILFVTLAVHLPTAILAGAGHDDAWFWRRAESIAAGHWMGEYNQMTLMKGSGYPLFLAINHGLGLPVSMTQALLYAGACLLVGAAVYRISRRPWLSLLVVLALQWHPAAMAWTRVLRDNIGAAQILFALACLLYFLFAPHAGRRGWRWAALSGLAFAWLWSTREDGIWIVPGVVLLVLACGAQAWRDRDERRRLVVGGMLMAIAFAGWLSLVATVNLVKYGVFVTVETRESAYSDAMAALQRVRVGEPVPYVPVPRDVREAIYAASPAFARLRPHLEGADRRWTGSGCLFYPHTCGDYAGGWFMWAFRDAVASIGEYRSAPAAEAFYRQVADEVGNACDEGRLSCASSIIGSMPPVAAAQWETLPVRVRSALSLLFWQGIGDGQTESHVRLPYAREMWNFVGRPAVPDAADTLGAWMIGWFHDTRPGWLQLKCATSAEIVAIQRQPSPDIARHFGDPGADENRFAFVVPALDGCAVESTTGAGAVQLSDVAATTRDFKLGSGRLRFDFVYAGIPREAEAPMSARWIKYGIGLFYGRILPWLAIAGLLAFSWESIRALRLRRLQPLYVLAAAAWCLVASRLMLLVLVDMSSFPALKVHYMQPAYPLLVLAAIVSLSLFTRDAGGASGAARPVREPDG